MKRKEVLQEPSLCRIYILAVFDDLQKFFDVRKEVEARFGPVDYASDSLTAEDLPSQYSGIPRRNARILSFQRPSGREELVDFRKRTLSIEDKLLSDGIPAVELIPGYVSEYNVIESAVEDDFNRIYLYGGIFAGSLYYYENHSFRTFSHSPQFYSRKEVVMIFNDLRLILTGGKT